MAEVKEIGKYENHIHIDASDDASTHSTSGGYLMTPHETLNYTGSGVRVGILETYGYDSSASHLSRKTIVKKDDVTTVNYLSHGTMVTSILAGKPVLLNGTMYQGIAPNASIYYATGSFFNEDKKALYWLIVTKNVSVINMSGGYSNNTLVYDDMEQYYDCLISQYRTVIVVAAGNSGEGNGHIYSPALAYNVISVGNISNTKDSNNKYIMSSKSSYASVSYLNKPDISAFGTEVKMVYNRALTENQSGTSYSAPMVTGTVALMMEANPNLIGKPDAVKAILVSSADNNAISSSLSNSSLANCYTNTSIGTLQGSCELKNKSGAGMLRIKTAVSMAKNKTIMYRFAIPTSSTEANASFTIDTFTLPTENTYKATLVFEKATDNEGTTSSNFASSFKFGVYNSQNQEIISSKSNNSDDEGKNENVQSIKINVLTGGAYTFKITCERMEGNNITPPEIIDENGNTVSHQAHGNIYMTFILSCTCDTPGVVADEETSLIHSISCENCGYMLEEANDKMVEYTKSFTGVNVKSTAYYKLRPFNHDYTDIVIISEHTDPVLTPTSSSYGAQYIREIRDTNVYSDRYTVSWTFEIIVFSSDGIVNDFRTCITLNLYYDTRPAAFSYTYTQL